MAEAFVNIAYNDAYDDNTPELSTTVTADNFGQGGSPKTEVGYGGPSTSHERRHFNQSELHILNNKDDVNKLMRADDYFKTSTLTSKESLKAVATLQQELLSDNTLYGELVVFGTTPSRFPGGNSARRRSKLQLRRRTKPNGVIPYKDYYSNGQMPKQNCGPDKENTSLEFSKLSISSHVVSYSLSRSRNYVVEYADTPNMDMFQIGRSTESNIDMVLIDTVSGATCLEDCTRAESTISRYACRIMVDRSPSNWGVETGKNGRDVFVPRIYAAGFDANRSIQLGERALKWEVKNEKGVANSGSGGSQVDGLTTNGVLILNPDEKGSYSKSTWREVSVCGNIYTMRDNKHKNVVHKVPGESNELRDGCLIDLCGTTLLWRSAAHVHSILDEVEFVEKVQKSINSKRPQCPISFNTLYLPKTKKLSINQDGSSNGAHSAPAAASTTAAYNHGNKCHRRTSRPPLPEVMDSRIKSAGSNDSTDSNSNQNDSRPYACFPCGHVYGYFEPFKKSSQHAEGGSSDSSSHGGDKSSNRDCPLCRQASILVPLSLGDEPAFHMDSEEPTCAFNPCGHTCSPATARHWSNVLIPSSTGGKRMCPFCAITLKDKGYVELIFQDRFI